MAFVYVNLLVLGIVLLTVVGDYFLKLASQQPAPFFNILFFLGFTIYALSAFGWVIAMQHMKLVTVGVVYALATVLTMAALGVFVFDETLNKSEVAGIFCAALAMVLLSRFSS